MSSAGYNPTNRGTAPAYVDQTCLAATQQPGSTHGTRYAPRHRRPEERWRSNSLGHLDRQAGITQRTPARPSSCKPVRPGIREQDSGSGEVTGTGGPVTSAGPSSCQWRDQSIGSYQTSFTSPPSSLASSTHPKPQPNLAHSTLDTRIHALLRGISTSRASQGRGRQNAACTPLTGPADGERLLRTVGHAVGPPPRLMCVNSPPIQTPGSRISACRNASLRGHVRYHDCPCDRCRTASRSVHVAGVAVSPRSLDRAHETLRTRLERYGEVDGIRFYRTRLTQGLHSAHVR